ncbi:MAG TPA: hypothetical protein VE982_03560 [Gaiellaceae bacterium]|nr:hypothetical protein [Gaiellaceae bacterium]
MRRLERREPTQRLHALALGSDGTAAAALVGRHDDVDEALEEVALRRVAGAPGRLERLVRLEERAGFCEPEAVFVGELDGATVS